MKADDELDNLFRDRLAGELTPMRGQAGRAFAREVLGPMRRRIAQERRQRAWWVAGQSSCSLAASMALGFFVPMWLSSGSASPTEVEGGRQLLVDYEVQSSRDGSTTPPRHN